MTLYRSPSKVLKRARASFDELCYVSSLSKQITPRQTQVYCVGTAKSGTHSVASLFSGQLRTYHEADARRMIELVLGVAAGEVKREVLERHLIKRDRRFALDIDSSQINYFCLQELVRLFPNAKFILTIRDPYTWLDSLINHQLARGAPPGWLRLREFRFVREHTDYPAEERALEVKGLYTLDGYLSYWAKHNRDVLELVPPERLLIVRTDQLTARTADIAQFVKLPQEGSDTCLGESHAFRAKKKFGVLAEINPEHLNGKIYQHCYGLMGRFFPERIPRLARWVRRSGFERRLGLSSRPALVANRTYRPLSYGSRSVS